MVRINYCFLLALTKYDWPETYENFAKFSI